MAHSQLDSHMLELLALKTGRVQASLPGLLESSYQQAKAANSLDYTKDKIGFRLDVLAKNGKPIFVTFKRAAKKGKHQAPYALIYIDDYDAPSTSLEVNKIIGDSPAQALENFAFLGGFSPVSCQYGNTGRMGFSSCREKKSLHTKKIHPIHLLPHSIGG